MRAGAAGGGEGDDVSETTNTATYTLADVALETMVRKRLAYLGIQMDRHAEAGKKLYYEYHGQYAALTDVLAAQRHMRAAGVPTEAPRKETT